MIRTVARMSAAALIVSGLMGSLALPAFAESQSVRIGSSDLDLASQAGRDALERRIHRAVDQVCGPSGGVTMSERLNYVTCSRTAQADAMAQLQVAVDAAKNRKVAAAQKLPVSVQ
jgi:UrcA family protein